jgi:hypothetical protein
VESQQTNPSSYMVEGNTYRNLIAERDALAKALREILNRPDVWDQEESDLLVSTFKRADEQHGLRETLFAVVTAYLNHKRNSLMER